jgi:predicted RNA-binding Zn-ribbon protein involved in translation (DUF1610 family)
VGGRDCLHNWAYRYSFSGKENEEKTNILQCCWQLVMWKKETVAEMMMVDRGKVISDLQELRGSQETMKLISDTIALLKEQEAVEPSFNKIMKHFVCPNCSLVLDEGRDDYCPSCGKEIAWDEYYVHEDD